MEASRNAGLGQLFFERTRARYAEVKDAGGQRCIGFAAPKTSTK
jgi:hypothetical protein